LRILVGLLIGLSGCTCVPQPRAVVSHVAGYRPLIDAIVRDDVPAMSQWSDNLVGPDDDDDGGSSETIGAGLGFLRVAMAPDERAMALVALSEGCGQCHVARGITPPRRPDSSVHAEGAVWALYALVWGVPMGESSHPQPTVVSAARADSAKMAAQQVVETCQRCHSVPKD
jgi:cytochrome c553